MYMSSIVTFLFFRYNAFHIGMHDENHNTLTGQKRESKLWESLTEVEQIQSLSVYERSGICL